MSLRLHSYAGVSGIAKAHEGRLPAQEMVNYGEPRETGRSFARSAGQGRPALSSGQRKQQQQLEVRNAKSAEP
jgi:hypothetical protein